MSRVVNVVTHMKGVVVHKFSAFLNTLRKETAAGEGITLFDGEIKPHLAVFQNIVSNKLIVGYFICWFSAKQTNSLGVHRSIFRLSEDTFCVSNIKRV